MQLNLLGQDSKKDTSTKDTTLQRIKKSDPGSISFLEYRMITDTFYQWDSNFYLVQRYNPILNRTFSYTDLGAIGSPHRILENNFHISSGQQIGFSPYEALDQRIEKISVYRAFVPFAIFNYTQGGAGSTVFKALHTQNIRKDWNIQAGVNSITYQLPYLTQQGTNSGPRHTHKAMHIASFFTSKNKKIRSYQIAIWNRARREESGGTDSSFFVDSGIGSILGIQRRVVNATVYSTNLSGANSIFKNNQYYSELQFDLFPKVTLFQQTTWNRSVYQYKDESINLNNPSEIQIYDTNFIFRNSNSAFINDSNAWNQWQFCQGITNKISKTNPIPLSFSVWNSFSRTTYFSRIKTQKDVFYTNGIHSKIIFNPYASYKIQGFINGDFYLSGLNFGDYLLHSGLKLNLSNRIKITTEIKSQLFEPFLFARNFVSYATRWDNKNGKKIATNSLRGNIAFLFNNIKVDGGLELGNSMNNLYITEKGTYNQLNSRINYISAFSNISIKFYNWNLNYKMLFQKNNNQYFSVPLMSQFIGIYWQKKLFASKALLGRIGLDIWHLSQYNSFQYNPVGAVFQPIVGKKSGNYPIVDFYLSGEIKTIQFYIKTEHINYNLFGYGFNNYFISSNFYPMEPFRVRIGFVWRFYY